MESRICVHNSCNKHYKVSSENCEHHENWGKVEGGLTHTFQGTFFSYYNANSPILVTLKTYFPLINDKKLPKLTLQIYIFF